MSTARPRSRARGASAVEYLVALVFVGLASVAGYKAFGRSLLCRLAGASQALGSGKFASTCSDGAVAGGGGGGGGGAAGAKGGAGGGGGGAGGGGAGGGGQGGGAVAQAGGGDKEDGASGPTPSGVCVGGVCTSEGNCFVAGTPVWTDQGLRPIESITAGTRVLSRDQEGAELDWKPVVRTFVRQTHSLVELTLGEAQDRETIQLTPSHRVQVAGRGWVEAESLEPGQDRLVRPDGSEIAVDAALSMARDVTVYNFEVEDFHTYFVGAHAFWAHNTCSRHYDYAPGCPGCKADAEGRYVPPGKAQVYDAYADSRAYHSTANDNLPSIIGPSGSGLDPNRGGRGGASEAVGSQAFISNSQNYVHYTTNPNTASFYKGVTEDPTSFNPSSTRPGRPATTLDVYVPPRHPYQRDPDDPRDAYKTNEAIPPRYISNPNTVPPRSFDRAAIDAIRSRMPDGGRGLSDRDIYEILKNGGASPGFLPPPRPRPSGGGGGSRHHGGGGGGGRRYYN